jgi:hypothetical protein
MVMSRLEPRWSWVRFIRSSMTVLAVFIGLECAGYSYIRYLEPNWIMITRLRVRSTELAAALGRARVVQITDLHIDRFGFRERQMIWQVNRYRPDWIVITGDLINGREGWPVALAVIKELRAANGIWVVPGNTDNLFITPPPLEQGVEEIGAHVLRNARVPMGDRGAWLVGVDDPVERRDRLEHALAGLLLTERSSVILLAHSPDIMRRAGGPPAGPRWAHAWRPARHHMDPSVVVVCGARTVHGGTLPARRHGALRQPRHRLQSLAISLLRTPGGHRGGVSAIHTRATNGPCDADSLHRRGVAG